MEPSATSGPTIKAFAWNLLEADYRPRLGEEGWRELEHAIGHSGTQGFHDDTDLPLDDFNHALQLIDAKLGRGDGTEIAAAGRLAARRWGTLFQSLVTQWQGRPDKVLAIFAAEVYPYLVNQSAAPTTASEKEGELRIRLDDRLLEPYKRGLLEGFASLGGAVATVRTAPGNLMLVAWRLHDDASGPSRPSLLLSAVRLPFLAAAVVPALVGLAIAAQDGQFHAGWAALTVLGVALFQLGTNTINDYYDRLGASEPPGHGLPKTNSLRNLAILFYTLGTGLGLILVAYRGVEVLWLGLAGFLLGLLYSAPPVRLAHRGLGELAVAIGFGPLIVLGTYFVQRQAWSPEALLASLPLAFLIAAVLYINEFPDKQGDARVGKRTLIVRLPERPAVIGYMVLLGLTYLIILGGVALTSVPRYAAYAFPPWSLLGLITLPLAVYASVLLARNYRYPYRLIPANAFTILLHVTTGLLFGAGYLISLIA